MRKRNVFALFLATALVTGSLAGCGADSGNTVDATASGEQETAAESEKGADNNEVHLRVWAGEEDKDLIAKISDNFIAEHAI